jgi:hypothetical protein
MEDDLGPQRPISKAHGPVISTFPIELGPDYSTAAAEKKKGGVR